MNTYFVYALANGIYRQIIVEAINKRNAVDKLIQLYGTKITVYEVLAC